MRSIPGTRGLGLAMGLVMGLALLLAACQTAPPVASTPLPTLRPVHWDGRAAVTLIRADRLVEPMADPDYAAPVPQCTVFGDDRVRWVEPPEGDAAAAGALGRLLESPVDGVRLDSLARTVADSGFWDLEPLYGPDTGPLRELVIRLEGMGEHAVRVSESTAAPEAFESLFGLCPSLSQPDAAQEVIPTGGWIYAFPQPLPGDYSTAWPTGEAPLSSLVDQPRWLEGEVVSQVWIAQRDHGARATFESEGAAYRVMVRVPGISPDTPRRPRDLAEPLPSTIPWSTDPTMPIFVVRYTGGLPTLHRYIGANAVDGCTVFGDGRVIVSELPIGEAKVGHLTARLLAGFMEGWLNTGFFDPTPPAPTPPLADSIIQEVTITLDDGSSATRTYPLNTPYFDGVRNPCANLTTFEPLIPEGGYLWAEAVGPMTRFENNIEYALVQWPGEYLSLEDLDAPLWHGPQDVDAATEDAAQGPPVDELIFAWNNIHGGQDRPTVLFVYQGTAYAVYADVPGVTVRGAPLSTVPPPPTLTPTVPVDATAPVEATVAPTEPAAEE